MFHFFFDSSANKKSLELWDIYTRIAVLTQKQVQKFFPQGSQFSYTVIRQLKGY